MVAGPLPTDDLIVLARLNRIVILSLSTSFFLNGGRRSGLIPRVAVWARGIGRTIRKLLRGLRLNDLLDSGGDKPTTEHEYFYGCGIGGFEKWVISTVEQIKTGKRRT